MKEIFEFVFDVSMLAFVVGSMVTLGLSLTISETVTPFKNVRMVIRALVANFLLVPLFAFFLVWIIPVPEGLRTGIILLSLGGGAPFIPKIVETARGDVAGAVALMLLLLIVTIFFIPITVPLIFTGASVNSWDIAKSLIFIMLTPLVIALLIRARFSDIALRIQPLTARFTNITILVLAISMVFLYAETIYLNASVLPVIMIFFVGAMAIGYLSAGGNRNAHLILTVGTGLRNPPIAILVASYNFPAEPLATTTPLLVMIMGSVILFPLAMKLGKKRQRSRLPAQLPTPADQPVDTQDR